MIERLLYIHIPFCDSKCNYCAFNSYIDKNDLKTKYFTALINELKYQVEHFKIEKKSIKTLFIGGGTPSTWSIFFYEKIFDFINPYLKENIEITTEINPSATKEWLISIRELGVNRVSVGVQSFDNEKLKILGRNHTAKKAILAIENVYKSGIKNISLDLIYDIKTDNKEILLNDIQIASNLPITHLSSYSLSIEENTPFAKTPNIKSNNDNLAIWWIDIIEKYGFIPYEISSFAKEDKYQCSHNKGYWSYNQYLGAGCGAIGFIDNTRYQSSKSIEKYISNPIFYTKEVLSKQEQKLEKIFLGLRSNTGVLINIFTKKEKEKINILIQERKLQLIKDRLFNTSYILSDEILSFICF